MLVVTKDQIVRATRVIGHRLVQGLVTLQRAHVTSARDDLSPAVAFPVDPSVAELLFEASGTRCGGGARVVALDPSGREMDVLSRIDDSTYSGSLKISRNDSGEWRLVAVSDRAPVDCRVTVSARSSFGTVLTPLAKPAAAPRASYRRLMRGTPVLGDSLGFFVDFYGADDDFRATRARFVSDDGGREVSAPRELAATAGGVLLDGAESPAPFRVLIEGELGGFPFRRLSSRLFPAAASLRLVPQRGAGADSSMAPGATSLARFDVTNLGAGAVSFRIKLSCCKMIKSFW